MTIELDRDDILREISKNHMNDIELLANIADYGTNDWNAFRELVKKLVQKLKNSGELSDIPDFIEGL